jgi:hypothetical protein
MEAARTRRAAPIRSGRLALARIVGLAGAAVAIAIVAGIVLVVSDANPRNDIVEAVTDVARWLSGPFHGLFDLESNKGQVALNWGLAAVVYYAIARVIVRLLAR